MCPRSSDVRSYPDMRHRVPLLPRPLPSGTDPRRLAFSLHGDALIGVAGLRRFLHRRDAAPYSQCAEPAASAHRGRVAPRGIIRVH
jgi:hypothetical protein